MIEGEEEREGRRMVAVGGIKGDGDEEREEARDVREGGETDRKED